MVDYDPNISDIPFLMDRVPQGTLKVWQALYRAVMPDGAAE